MKKLKLDVESLKVESFDVRPAGAQEGTIHGHYVSTADTCSMSAMMKCFAPPETITADVYAGECNTQQCQGGPGFTQLGCATNAYC